MNPRPSPISLRIILVVMAALLGLGSLAVRARFEPPIPSPTELLWLVTPALLAASSALSIPDRRGALGLLTGLAVSVTFTGVVWAQLAFAPSHSPTSTLVPTFLPFWQLGLPLTLGLSAWSLQTLRRRFRNRTQ